MTVDGGQKVALDPIDRASHFAATPLVVVEDNLVYQA
jgi:hypothetical protein